MILLDTHALFWWAVDPDKLTSLAKSICEQMETEGGFASSISIWELGIKLKRKKIELGIGINEFVRRLEKSAVVELLPVDTTVWLRSLSLDWDHRDPADRVIVATAQLKKLPILTKDEVIRSYHNVECRW